MLRLCLLTTLWLCGSAVPAAVAQPAATTSTTSPASTTSDVPADLQAELDSLLRGAWHPTLSARTELGWRDNILLSPFAPIGRAFGRGEIDAMLLRPMRDHWEFVSFLNGDVLRYFSPIPETGGEQQWSLHTEGRWQPADPVRVALKATGYLRDMVIDLSETEARRIVAPTRVRGGYMGSAVRLSLPAGFRFEPSVQFKRTDYRTYAGDYDETRAGGRLEWRRGNVLTLSAGWFEVRRPYTQRTEYSASGRALIGTHLRFRQRDGDLKIRIDWQARGDWSLTATAGRLENRDDASGYFDYDQRRGRLELSWQRDPWHAALDAEAKRLEYRGQTVGAGIDPPMRISDDFDVSLRVERELNPRWQVFAEHRWERSRSNEIGFSYRANTVLAGVQRTF